LFKIHLSVKVLRKTVSIQRVLLVSQMVAKSRPQYSHIEETQTTVDVSSTATDKKQ